MAQAVAKAPPHPPPHAGCAPGPDGSDPGEPYVIVHGTEGHITLWHKQDRVLVQRTGHGSEEVLHGRTDLLENLLDHLADRTELLVPPTSTGAFMQVVESIRRAPDPRPLPVGAWRSVPGAYEGVRRRIVHGIDGIDGLVAASAETLCGYAELGTFWALPNGNPAPRPPAAGPSTAEPTADEDRTPQTPTKAPTPDGSPAPQAPTGEPTPEPSPAENPPR